MFTLGFIAGVCTLIFIIKYTKHQVRKGAFRYEEKIPENTIWICDETKLEYKVHSIIEDQSINYLKVLYTRNGEFYVRNLFDFYNKFSMKRNLF